MPIAPLDLQVNMAQMINVAQQQQVAITHPYLQQEYMGIKVREESNINREKVQTIEKVEGGRIENEKKGGSGGYYSIKRRKKRGESKEEGFKWEEDLDLHRGHSIDIIR